MPPARDASCTGLLGSYSTTRPLGARNMTTLSQRRYQTSKTAMRPSSGLFHACSSTVQPRPAPVPSDSPVDCPPSRLSSMAMSASPRPRLNSCWRWAGNTNAKRCGSIQRLRSSHWALLSSGSNSACMSHQISLRPMARQIYGYWVGSLSRATSTQPRPTAACGRKASLHARSAWLWRSAWLSLKFNASATSCPPTSPSGETRQSRRVLASSPVMPSMVGAITFSTAGGMPFAAWERSTSASY